MTVSVQNEPVVLVGTMAEMANYVVSNMPIGYLFFAKDDGPNGTFYVVDIVAGVRSWKPIGGSSSGGQTFEFIYTQGAPDAAPVYGNFANMMAAIALLPAGALPRVTFMPPAVGGPNVTVPLAGMPVGGWDMFLGSWNSFTPATGTLIVELEDGVILKDLARIEYGLVVRASPTSDYGVFQYSFDPRILQIANGAAIQNLSAGNTLMNAPPGSFTVLAMSFASSKAIPPSSGPYVRGTGGTVIGSQIASGPYGQLPDGWIDGNGMLLYQNGADSNNPITPGWTSGVAAVFNSPASRSVIFQPGGATNGNVYSSWPEVVSAIDRADGAATLFIDDSISPAFVTSDLDGRGKLVITSADNENGSINTFLTISDGSKISNIARVYGQIVIEAQAKTVVPLQWTYNPYFVLEQATIRLMTGSLVPMISLPAPSGKYLFEVRDSALFESQEATVPCISMSGVSTLRYRVIDHNAKDPIASNSFGDDGTCSIIMISDASGVAMTPIDNPLFSGTISYDKNDNAEFSTYAFTLAPLGTWAAPEPTNVQEAIDRIAAAVAGLLGGPIP